MEVDQVWMMNKAHQVCQSRLVSENLEEALAFVACHMRFVEEVCRIGFVAKKVYRKFVEEKVCHNLAGEKVYHKLAGEKVYHKIVEVCHKACRKV